MTSPALNYAILSLDSYNRGYDPGVPGIDGPVVSDYSFRLDSAILVDSNGTRQDIAASFYAAAYQDAAGNIVISYRGTDNPGGDIPAWTGGAGFQTRQAELAAEFYYQVKAAYPGATITLTGHSLGGGLAGLMA